CAKAASLDGRRWCFWKALHAVRITKRSQMIEEIRAVGILRSQKKPSDPIAADDRAAPTLREFATRDHRAGGGCGQRDRMKQTHVCRAVYRRHVDIDPNSPLSK